MQLRRPSPSLPKLPKAYTRQLQSDDEEDVQKPAEPANSEAIRDGGIGAGSRLTPNTTCAAAAALGGWIRNAPFCTLSTWEVVSYTNLHVKHSATASDNTTERIIKTVTIIIIMIRIIMVIVI